jgi:hypothetical protein
MLVTTNRYAPKELRELARGLAIVFAGAYVARGKKTVNGLVDEARKGGHSRICFVMLRRLEFAKVDELGGWSWMNPLHLTAFKLTGELTTCESLEGDPKLSELWDFELNEKGDGVASAKDGKLLFSSEAGSLELVYGHERKLRA